MLQIVVFGYGFSPQPGRPLAAASLQNRNSDEVRCDTIVVEIVVEKERRCAVCKVKRRSCFKRGVHLHDTYFFMYHVK